MTSEGVQYGRWEAIETAPKDGTPILLWSSGKHGSVNVGYYNKHYTQPWHALVLGEDALWNDDDSPQPIFDATHWMPLPMSPDASLSVPTPDRLAEIRAQVEQKIAATAVRAHQWAYRDVLALFDARKET